MSEPLHISRTPTPWEVIPSTEHHGPYIVSPYGSTLADLYVMSNPSALSVRNGGDSKPIHFPDADANASFIVRACNAHDHLVNALTRLMKVGKLANAADYEVARKALDRALG